MKRYIILLSEPGLILSYPKSGRTWIRAFLHIYQDLTKYKSNISYEHILTNDNKQFKRLMLIRHPCDILVSLYFQFSVRYGQNIGTMKDFIRSDIGAVDIDKRWNTWLTEPQEIIKYEDLFKPIWKKILKWFGIGIKNKAIKKADEICRFDNIRKNLHLFAKLIDRRRFLAMENWKVKVKPTNPDAHKFRRGIPNGYVDYLDSDDVTFIEKTIPIASRWYDYIK